MTEENGCSRYDVKKSLQYREGLYGLLAQCFLTEPSLEFLNEISKQVHLLGDNTLLSEGYELLNKYFAGTRGELDVAQRDLAIEFAYLFIAPSAHRVHPYESVQRSNKRLFKQEAHDEVVHALRECGIEKRKECKELEDHISLEFEFMEFLCRKTLDVLHYDETEKARELLERQRAFVVMHLTKWIPQFSRSVFHEAKSPFYQGIALLAEAFMNAESDQIDRLMESLAGPA